MSDLCLPRFVVEVLSDLEDPNAWHPVAWFTTQDDAESYQFAIDLVARVRDILHATVSIRPSSAYMEIDGDAYLMLLLRPGEEVS
jgi:hypothetical protein